MLARSSWVSLRPYRQGDYKHVLRGGYILLLFLSIFPFEMEQLLTASLRLQRTLLHRSLPSSTPPSPSAFDSSSYP